MTVSIGPLIGHTTPASVKIWLKASEDGARGLPASARYRAVFHLYDAGGRHHATKRSALTAADDFTARVTFTGLAPGTAYHVGVDTAPDGARGTPALSDLARTGGFRTAPDPASPQARRIRFVFGSCRYFSWSRTTSDLGDGDRTFRTINRLHERTPLDLALMIGDQIYADAFSGTLPASRLRDFYKAYRIGFAQPQIGRLFGRVPTYMILDDHEIRNDWSRDRLASNRALFRNAMHAYRVYQDCHNPNHARAPTDPEAGDWWYSFERGAFPFFVMDVRTQRLREPPGGARATMLGDRQRAALLRWLRRHRAAPRLFIVTPVPFFPDTRDEAWFDDPADKWTGFNAERVEILDAIKAAGIVDRCVFLGGDVHNSHFARLTSDQDPAFRVTSVVSSGFHLRTTMGEGDFHHSATLPDPPAAGRGATDRYAYDAEDFYAASSFVLVDCDLASGGSGRCTASIMSLNGTLRRGPYGI